MRCCCRKNPTLTTQTRSITRSITEQISTRFPSIGLYTDYFDLAILRFLEFIIHMQQYQFMDIQKSFDFRPVGRELAENGETLRWLVNPVLNRVLERPITFA